MCETLGALCSQFCNKKFSSLGQNYIDLEKQNPFQQILPSLLRKLEIIVDRNAADKDEKNVRFAEILSAVCLQSMLGCFMSQRVLDVFDKVFAVSSHWTQYRIARSASRYGQHYFAAKIYQRLSSHVAIETLHFFLVALSQISKAECVLNHGYEFETILANYSLIEPSEQCEETMLLPQLTMAERLDKAITLYWKALATLKVIFKFSLKNYFQLHLFRLAPHPHIHLLSNQNLYVCVVISWKPCSMLLLLKILKV